jgi:antitoxin PrlF
MAVLLEEISTITAKGRATIPKSVRQALGVDHGGRIVFRVDEQREVTVHRADDEHHDPVIDRFVAFLARDIERRPEVVKPLSPTLAERIKMLTKNISVNLDEAIDGDVDL